ncbi:hypothetical protein WA026_008713 [Henosepilachna vigintioctopunctata]|uniref:RNase H type-1 domain-containing protein n=1 Tax=Henosepilachna vigintioctopunctata TaxID=420089 RepID=A0AAW1VC73_9CUCU
MIFVYCSLISASEKLHIEENHPLYTLHYWCIKSSLEIVIPEYNEPFQLLELYDFVNKRFSGYYQLYTDASKSSSSSVGIAVFDRFLRASKQLTLSSYFSVFGELSAILLALEYVVIFYTVINENKFVVISESQSALLPLEKLKTSNQFTVIHRYILERIFILESKGILVQFLSVRARVGITRITEYI